MSKYGPEITLYLDTFHAVCIWAVREWNKKIILIITGNNKTKKEIIRGKYKESLTPNKQLP